MNATATRSYTVCRSDTLELVMRIEADSDYDARTTVSRMTGWSLQALTTQMKKATQ